MADKTFSVTSFTEARTICAKAAEVWGDVTYAAPLIRGGSDCVYSFVINPTNKTLMFVGHTPSVHDPIIPLEEVSLLLFGSTTQALGSSAVGGQEKGESVKDAPPPASIFTEDQLQRMSTPELKTLATQIATKRGDPTDWITYAQKPTLVGYLSGKLPPSLNHVIQEQGQAQEGSPSGVANEEQAKQDLLNALVDKMMRQKSQNQDKKDGESGSESNQEQQEQLDYDSFTEMVKESVKDLVEKIKPQKIQIQDLPAVSLDSQHFKAQELIEWYATDANIYLKGPAGSGKTFSAKWVADQFKHKIFLLNSVQTRFDVLGYENIKGKIFMTPLLAWGMYEGDACLVWDEVDGCGGEAQLAVNGALADGELIIPGQSTIDVTFGGKYVKRVISTANTWGVGADAAYVGRMRLDAAFLNRFPAQISWPYDSALEARICQSYTSNKDDRRRIGEWVTIVQKVRKNVDQAGIRVVISPRQAIAGTKALLSVNMKLTRCIDTLLLSSMSDTQKKSALKGLEKVVEVLKEKEAAEDEKQKEESLKKEEVTKDG